MADDPAARDGLIVRTYVDLFDKLGSKVSPGTDYVTLFSRALEVPDVRYLGHGGYKIHWGNTRTGIVTLKHVRTAQLPGTSVHTSQRQTGLRDRRIVPQGSGLQP